MAKKSKKAKNVQAEVETVEIAMSDVATVEPSDFTDFPPSDAEMDEMISALDEVEAQAEDVVDEAPAEVLDQAEGLTFEQITDSFSDEEVTEVVHEIAACIDDRVEFEKDKNPDNNNIQRTLKKAREQMVTKRAAKVFLATNVSPNIMNRVFHEGSRYNVYAIGKLGDVVRGLTDGTLMNAINLACMRSLFAFRKAGLTFTGEMAKAAASDKIRITDSAIKAALVRHTVSASTAPTQASSTMQALETLGIVKREGSHRNPIFTLTDNPAVAKLEKLLDAA